MCGTVESEVTSKMLGNVSACLLVGCYCGVLGQSIRGELGLDPIVVMSSFTVSLDSNSSHITLWEGGV